MAKLDPITLNRIEITLCSLCLEGAGGECHVPGCALFLNRAPELAIDPHFYRSIEANPTAPTFRAEFEWRGEELKSPIPIDDDEPIAVSFEDRDEPLGPAFALIVAAAGAWVKANWEGSADWADALDLSTRIAAEAYPYVQDVASGARSAAEVVAQVAGREADYD